MFYISPDTGKGVLMNREQGTVMHLYVEVRNFLKLSQDTTALEALLNKILETGTSHYFPIWL